MLDPLLPENLPQLLCEDVFLDMESLKTIQSKQNLKQFIHYGNKSGINRQIGP